MRSTSRPAIRPASRVAWRCESSKYAGTVMTALVGFPARCRTSLRIIAESSSGVYSRPAILTCSTFRPSPVSCSTIWCGMSSSSFFKSASVRPMSRLTLKMVCSGSESARSFAAVPTRTVPLS